MMSGSGQLWLRLTLTFVGVALAAVSATFLLTSLTVEPEASQLISQQEADLAKATAVAAGAAYEPAGWEPADLSPIIDLDARAGAAMQTTNMAGRIILTSPGFAGLSTVSQRREPVLVRGRHVGWVTIRFGRGGLRAAVTEFLAERWRARTGAAGIAVLLALVVGLAVSRRITLPLERLLAAVRARGAGDHSVRIRDVRGFGVLRELSLAFNQSTDSVDRQDRVRRNLVADVAHELRTPVAVLQAGHEAMLDGVAEPTPENLGSLRDEVLRLARMVDDLQRLAAAEAAALQLTLVPQDLAAIAAQAAASLSDSFEAAGISLIRRLADVRIRCDPDRMRDVVTNLLTNALKFTPAGGRVVLETRPEARQLARLRVSDTGIGIPPDELPLVTERFFRGQRAPEMAVGSGIGLTIVSELVSAQNGKVDITSEPGQGTQVSVTLPRDQ